MKLITLFTTLSAMLIAVSLQAQKSAEVILLDPVLASGADALDPEIPDPNGGIQDITIIADGAPTKADLTAVPGFQVMQDWKAGEGEDKVYFGRYGETESNVVTFSDASLPTITVTWEPDFPGDVSDFSGFPTIGNANAVRWSWTSGPLAADVTEENPVDADNIFLGSATAGAGKGLGFRFAIAFDKPLAAAGFTIPRSEVTGKTEEEGETVWEAAFYNAAGDLLSRQTARPGEGANVAALFGYIAAGGEGISKIVIGDIEEFYLAGGSTGRMFLDDLGFAVAGGAGQVLLDYDFSTADRTTMNLPDEAPWYFYKDTTSTATLEVEDGSIGYTIPPADSWRPAGALIPFAEPGGVTVGVGQELAVKFAVTMDNVAFNGANAGGMRWGIYSYGDTPETRPTDDQLNNLFPGIGTTGYVTSFSFHGDSSDDMHSWGKRTNQENDALLGSYGASTWFPDQGVEINFLKSLTGEEQVFFPNELIHGEISAARTSESEMVLTLTLSNAAGEVVFQTQVVDNGFADLDPYTTFDSFVFRAQVTGGSATGGVQGDPRAGVEEVISTMHFSQLKVEVREISSSGFPFYIYGPAGAGSLEEVDGNLVFTSPGSGGYYSTLSGLPGIDIVPGEKLVLTQTIIPTNVLGSSTNNRFGIFSYADAPGGQPTGDIPDAPGADLPGFGAVGYQWTFPVGQVRQVDPRSGAVTINMGIRKRRFGLAGEVTDELQGRSGDYIWLPLTTLVEPVKNFTAEEVHTMEFTIELVRARSAVIGLTLYDSASEVFGKWAAVDASGDPYTQFDTFALRDGNVSSSGSPLTILNMDVMMGAATTNVYGRWILDETGWIDTGEFLGWIYAGMAPWIYNLPLDKWIYGPEESITPEGGWFYIPN